MTFYVQRGWLEGWDKPLVPCATLIDAYTLARLLDYPEGRLVRILDDDGRDCEYYSSTTQATAYKEGRLL
jgi:hypothetical protein